MMRDLWCISFFGTTSLEGNTSEVENRSLVLEEDSKH